MRIHFPLPPPARSAPSGGDLYVQRLCSAIGGLGVGQTDIVHPNDFRSYCEGLATNATQESTTFPVLAIDSLWLELIDPAECRKLPLSLRKILLLLWRPGNNPSCSNAEQQAHSHKEQCWVSCMDAMVVPSRTFEIQCQADYPGLPILCLPPTPKIPPQVSRPAKRLSGPLRLVTLSAIIPAKGVMEVVDAYLGALSQNAALSPSSLTLIGDTASDPGYVARIHSRISQASTTSPPDIRFTGALSAEEAMSLIANADLYLSASHFESFGMATQEAVSLGVPALVSNTGDARFLIHPGTNGHIFAPKDTHRLSHLLTQFLASPYNWITKTNQLPVSSDGNATWDEAAKKLRALCKSLRPAQ